MVLDVPGAIDTDCPGINAQGEIVGWYRDSFGTIHGYLRSHAGITTIDVPGSTFTIAFGINPQGEIVGFFNDATGRRHGFLAVPARGR